MLNKEMKMKNWAKYKTMGGRGGSSSGGWFYCWGLIGAAVYFIQQANGLGEVLVGLLKAVIWPAYFVWEFFQHLS